MRQHTHAHAHTQTHALTGRACSPLASADLGVELLIELLALGFWYMRPPTKLSSGLQQSLFTPYHLAVQRQWGLVVQRLAVWRRSIAAHAYWELTRLVPECSADYAHALQFVDWSPTDATSSQELAEYLHHQLQLAGSLEGEARLHHSRALTFTIEQLRLPLLPPELAERPMSAVQDWFGFAMSTAAVADERWADAKSRSARRQSAAALWRTPVAGEGAAATDDEEDNATNSPSPAPADRELEEASTGVVSFAEQSMTADGIGAATPTKAALAGSSPDGATAEEEAEHRAHVREQLTILELSVACVVQSSRDFFLAQAATLIEALRPHLWEPLSVEPALYCVLRLLRGPYHAVPPYWSAGPGALATAGAKSAPRSEAAAVHLGRYSVSMYPGETVRSHLVRLAHLQQVLFPGWGEPRDIVSMIVLKISESPVGGLVRAAGVGALSELPHATSLVEVLAEIVVCMAAHGVQWAVEQVIMPFLKFRKRADASAAYAMVGMRALALMLDPSTDFTSANARMQRDVPMLLAPAIELMLTSAYTQCGLQRVGLRYYPLPVDTPEGSVPDFFTAFHSNILTDFGKHPLGDRRGSDIDTVISMAASHPAKPRTAQEEAALESEWRARGVLKLVAYRGTSILGGDASMLKLSYGRVFVGVSRTREPGLVHRFFFSMPPFTLRRP